MATLAGLNSIGSSRKNTTTEGYIPLTDQPYMSMYEFERIDLPYWRKWFGDYWRWSLIISLLYVVIIFSIKRVMRDRRPFDLRRQLAAWNFAMALFSAVGFVRVMPEILYLLNQDNGLHSTACKLNEHGMSMAFWALVYTFSKVLQLGDTLFIVLRKKKLILLHWYHHCSALILCWYAYSVYIPLLRFVGSMNYFVHSWMYGYYGLRALDLKVPKRVSIFVTVLELIQMMIGFGITLFCLYQHKYGPEGCIISARAIAPSVGIYSTLFILFGRHFMNTAFKRRGIRAEGGGEKIKGT